MSAKKAVVPTEREEALALSLEYCRREEIPYERKEAIGMRAAGDFAGTAVVFCRFSSCVLADCDFSRSSFTDTTFAAAICRTVILPTPIFRIAVLKTANCSVHG